MLSPFRPARRKRRSNVRRQGVDWSRKDSAGSRPAPHPGYHGWKPGKGERVLAAIPRHQLGRESAKHPNLGGLIGRGGIGWSWFR